MILTFDQVMERPNVMLAHYLLSSFAYYELSTSVYSDHQFDELCRELIARWDEVDHPHKHLVSLEDLKAGTGYALVYPLMVRLSTYDWVQKHRSAIT